MVDALVSGASAERRVGSSPILGTSKGVFCRKLLFRFSRIGSFSLWRCGRGVCAVLLRVRDSPCCYATTIAN